MVSRHTYLGKGRIVNRHVLVFEILGRINTSTTTIFNNDKAGVAGSIDGGREGGKEEPT